MTERLLARAIRWLVPHLPAARRDLVSGLVNEAAAIPAAGERWRWLCAGLTFAVQSAVMRARLTWLAAFGGTGFLLYWLNGHANADIASQYCLAVLLAGGAVHGSRLSYRLAWLPGAALGLVLPASGLIAIALGDHGSGQPASAAAAASLTVLVIPSVAAAYAGAWLARSARPRRPGRGARG